ncbi:hypothetical protein [Hydrocarboniclastica marina]|uniref:Uncharacterized protein n=1 Tax=Hydrocarboniclastica marina TaxID=2259620 RepID=A0A4P7XM24_9ALTE|nr:hypothetical protein [Hydrocarboniclastica marina]QCF28045.1 hypothetical protein soil367_18400 [Hydrocarboniclastica marina]
MVKEFVGGSYLGLALCALLILPGCTDYPRAGSVTISDWDQNELSYEGVDGAVYGVDEEALRATEVFLSDREQLGSLLVKTWSAQLAGSGFPELDLRYPGADANSMVNLPADLRALAANKEAEIRTEVQNEASKTSTSLAEAVSELKQIEIAELRYQAVIEEADAKLKAAEDESSPGAIENAKKAVFLAQTQAAQNYGTISRRQYRSQELTQEIERNSRRLHKLSSDAYLTDQLERGYVSFAEEDHSKVRDYVKSMQVDVISKLKPLARIAQRDTNFEGSADGLEGLIVAGRMNLVGGKGSVSPHTFMSYVDLADESLTHDGRIKITINERNLVNTPALSENSGQEEIVLEALIRSVSKGGFNGEVLFSPGA